MSFTEDSIRPTEYVLSASKSSQLAESAVAEMNTTLIEHEAPDNVPNKDRIQELVDALRSGDFTQMRGMLGTKDSNGVVKHCCLGVASVQAGVELRWRSPTSMNPFLEAEFDGNDIEVLSKRVRDWYGFQDSNPFLIDETSCMKRQATFFNDEMQCNFERIAQLFEDTYINEEES